ncbi:MAG TPA: energy transducer TonB [Terriglobales bacterium]|nr:energy transducer TonB [Terriglobales bacterium]
MRHHPELILGFILALCLGLAAQTDEPVLLSANIPFYPPLARQARIYGSVRVAFTLPANSGEPTSVKAISGHPLLKSAAEENVKTWRFRNTYAVERKCETMFHYELTESESTHVTFKSFNVVEVVSEKPPPVDSNF